jgi:hypothetical protein
MVGVTGFDSCEPERPVAHSCEHGNEHLSSIKDEEFID